MVENGATDDRHSVISVLSDERKRLLFTYKLVHCTHRSAAAGKSFSLSNVWAHSGAVWRLLASRIPLPHYLVADVIP